MPTGLYQWEDVSNGSGDWAGRKYELPSGYRILHHLFPNFSALSSSAFLAIFKMAASEERVEIDLLQPEILSKECLLELLKQVCRLIDNAMLSIVAKFVRKRICMMCESGCKMSDNRPI